MKMNYKRLDKLLINHKLLKHFKASDMKFSRWLPICRYKSKELPRKIFLESYSRLIKTRGTEVRKNALRLKAGNKTLVSNWRFLLRPNKFRIHRGWLYAKVPEEYTCIFIENPFTKKMYATTLPRNVELLPEDFIAIGLLKGEMISSVRGKSRQYVSFTNADPVLTQIVLRFLEKLGVKKNKISYQLLVNTLEGNKFSYEEYVAHWSKILNVPEKCFVKPYFDVRHKTAYNWGSMSIKYYNTPFRLFLQFLVNYLIDNLNKNTAKYFLKGLLAAEGNINLSPNNSLNFIAIGCSKNEDILQYKRALKKVDILAGGVIRGVSDLEARKRVWKKGTGGYMMIQGWNNFRIIYLKNLLEFSPNKLLRFLFGLKHHREAKRDNVFKKINTDFEILRKKYADVYNEILDARNKITRNEEKILLLIRKRGFITIDNLSKQFNILPSSASRILNSMQRKGVINSFRNTRKTLWHIT